MSDTTNYLIVSAVCAVFMALIKVLYDSKCVKINMCCGCIEIERDIETELREDEMKSNETHTHHERRPSHQNMRSDN